jgi:hypothetical protein
LLLQALDLSKAIPDRLTNPHHHGDITPRSFRIVEIVLTSASSNLPLGNLTMKNYQKNKCIISHGPNE